MNENRIHRRYVTGILIALWWWALYTERIGAGVTNPIIGIPMLWGVPLVIYVVCRGLFPDDKPAR